MMRFKRLAAGLFWAVALGAIAFSCDDGGSSGDDEPEQGILRLENRTAACELDQYWVWPSKRGSGEETDDWGDERLEGLVIAPGGSMSLKLKPRKYNAYACSTNCVDCWEWEEVKVVEQKTTELEVD